MEYFANGLTLSVSDDCFPLSTDSMLLADFVRLPKNARVLDLGSGCGTLGLLLCAQDANCTVTGVESGVEIAWGQSAGTELISAAFSTVFGSKIGSLIVAIGIGLFALSTILSWSLYGTRCCEFLLGSKGAKIYQVIFVAVILVGATLKLDLVWNIADTLNGFMAIPNLIALLGLSGVVIKLTKDHFAK